MSAIHGEYKQDQANAICYSTWRDHKGKIATGDTFFAALARALGVPNTIEQLFRRRR
jgi:hypothetical protein